MNGRWWPILALMALTGIGLILTPVSTQRLLLFGIPLPGVCLFRLATGLPCPFCGMSRSFVNLLHGHWAASFASHPLGPFFFFLLAAYAIYHLVYAKDPPRLKGWMLGVSWLLLATWVVRLIIR